MKNLKALSLLLASVIAATASAQSDTTFTYQGSLNDSGSPANGVYDVGFTLFDALSGGAQVGMTITVLSQVITDGLITAPLDFGAAAFDGSPLWLEIVVDGSTLTPRQPVSYSPFSIQTRGLVVDSNKKVGIGTSSPNHPLHVVSPVGSLFTIFGLNNNDGGVGLYGQSSTAGGNGVRGWASALTGSTVGVFGQSRSTNGRGVFGLADADDGTTYGVYGLSFSPTGYGVFGRANANTGEGYGVYGQSDSVQGRGVVGKATASEGNTYGVLGITDSTIGRGVVGHASALTGLNYGVFGQSDSPLGRGVVGTAESTTGANTGVIGQTFSTNGIGLLGSAFATSGTTFGVFGNCNSPQGFDFFAGGAGVNYGSGSSVRWKKNITSIESPLEKLAQIRGVYFDWDEKHGGQHDVGMIAEEVGKVLPEIVSYEMNGYDAIGMDYSKLTPLLVEAVNALRAENDALKDRLDRLESAMQEDTTKADAP